MKYSIFFLFVALVFSCSVPTQKEIVVSGELKQWHKVTLEIPGPESSEWAEDNPFLNYKLEVLFSQDGRSYKVPGYYAADGNAGETSSREGNIWKAHFRPDATGAWEYKVLFRKGKNIAVVDGEDPGEALEYDGAEGRMEISASDKSAPDFKSMGRIINGGKGYFSFQESGQLWIKNGADSPENFLAYVDFDQTSRFSLKKEIREGEADPKKGLHRYEAHIADWNEGDPTWQGGKGKAIIGAVNYLHSAGVNSIYMLTMNILGDGKDVWPYTDYNERYRFDCSKLDQWEVLFDHMEELGVMMHFVLQETENEVLLDGGYTDVQRRIYLRELVARFAHHAAISWNIGEENGPAHWTPIGQTDQQKKDMMTYLKGINPYPSNLVLHTHADDHHQDEYLEPMLGFEHLDGPSMQVGDPKKVHERVLKWVQASEEAGKRWVVNLDEIGPAYKGAMPESHDPDHDTIRHFSLWGTLLAGGAGVEWYMGYRFPHNDLNCEDFRSRANWWKQSTIATRFVNQFPLEEMFCSDDLLKTKGAYCLCKPGEIYIVYLPAGPKQAGIQLGGVGRYSVRWYNPREGGDLQEGSVSMLESRGLKNPGLPPSDVEKDWVVLLEKL
jgi:hypothetical protein